MPGYHAHALETLCEIASFLAARFPQLYTVTRARYDPADERTHGDSVVGEEKGAVTGIANLITGETFDFAAIEAREGPEWNPMRVAGCESALGISRSVGQIGSLTERLQCFCRTISL